MAFLPAPSVVRLLSHSQTAQGARKASCVLAALLAAWWRSLTCLPVASVASVPAGAAAGEVTVMVPAEIADKFNRALVS